MGLGVIVCTHLETSANQDPDSESGLNFCGTIHG